MNNMERLLGEIKIVDIEPTEELVRQTKMECSKLVRAEKKAELLNSSRRGRIAVRLLAAASVVAFIFVAFLVASIRNQNPINGAAYYTVDINPSFGFTVDEDNIVTNVSFQNDDAKELYKGIDCKGMKLQDAIRLIVVRAVEMGYISEDGKTYVLLGQFLKDGSEEGEELLSYLLASLQNELGDGVKLLGVNGKTDDIQTAKDLKVSPGLLLLCNIAEDVEADADLKVDDVVKCLPDDYNGEPEFAAPVISGTAKDDKLLISWENIDFSKVNAEGIEVEYKLLKGTTLDEIKEMKNVVKTQRVKIENEQPNSFSISLSAGELNTKTYYCLYVKCNNTGKLSNVLPVTAQISGEPTAEPTASPEPGTAAGTSKISGNIAGDYVLLEWTGIDSERFDGYKVMYSYTDTTPVYGEEGCSYIEYVTDPAKTSGKYKLTSLNGYKEGRKFYFSITVLYDGQEQKVPGNVISLVMPTVQPGTTPNTQDYPSTNISGSRDGNYIYLNWGKITDDRLEGYKVVYSFTDSTPVYGSSDYLRWITNPSETSAVISLDELGYVDAAKPCYFSITALYEDHSVKRPGNTVTIMIPANAVEYTAPAGISASYNEATGKITISWSSVENSSLEYYKANYSFTNSSPSYGASGTTSFPTNELSYSVLARSLDGYQEGATCYVSVTAVYNPDYTKKTSSVKTVVIPITITPSPEPTDTPSPEPTTETPTASPTPEPTATPTPEPTVSPTDSATSS
ncbi:MAG: hypothetical protein AB1Z23_01185 [Eubacteriales bacterium]